MSLLTKLQSKPPAVRARIAFGGALMITGAIAFIWLLALPTQLKFDTAAPTAASPEIGGSMSLFWSEAKGRFARLTASVHDAAPTPDTAGDAAAPEAAASATSSSPQPAVVMPDLSSAKSSSSATATEPARPSEPNPPTRTILIGTTSAELPATSQNQ